MNRYSTFTLAMIFVAVASASAFAQQAQATGASQNSNPMIAELKQMYTSVGYMAVYLRLKSIVPPSSERR